ncbi:YeeE/YedE family protein [Pseudorhodoferax sp.]|uniref:YeeE/YedE family protein n=1 Tax=Pseudorhodoferax sp. TaxID=1993553 RepID=UPI002DD6A4C0|nr:YeeE/YedE family protein [Pseudorhodoferax sp.]
MLDPDRPDSIARAVVLGGLAIGLALGVLGQASRFCIRGAIADWVVLRNPARLASWLLAIGVGAVCVQGLVGAGWLDAARTLALTERMAWLSYAVGGLLFGYGMVLAGGCPQRCLVKAGAGNLRAAAVLVVVAIAALMTLRGAFAELRVRYLDAWSSALGRPQDLGSLLAHGLDADAAMLRWALSLALLAASLAFAWRVRGRLDGLHWAGGIGVGLLLAAAFWATGHVGHVAEHPETLEPAWLGTHSRRPEGLSFAAPMASLLDLLTMWTDRANVLTFGVALACGVLAGSHLSARWRGELRTESFSTPKELASHTAGALLMGFGGITALGCSVGNGVTGLALLSVGAGLAVAGIVAGAWLALVLQARGTPVAPSPGPGRTC